METNFSELKLYPVRFERLWFKSEITGNEKNG
jgi:hypothetical protein